MTLKGEARQLERSCGIAPPGFRLPDATRVGAVHLQIADLQQSIDYYRDVLGLRVLEQLVDSAGLGAFGTDQDRSIVPDDSLHARVSLTGASN
jgi:catechol-2,3-dioxygenase